MGGRKKKSVIGLVVAAGLLGSFAYGYLCNERELPGYGLMTRAYEWARGNPATRRAFFSVRDGGAGGDTLPGRWETAPAAPAEPGALTGAQRDAVRQLGAIGYLPAYEPAGALSGVTTHVPDLAWDGLNLYTSGDAPQAVLIDMSGEALHTWRCGFAEAFPDRPLPGAEWRDDTWVRVHLFPNGDLLAIFERLGMVKLDVHSRPLWANPRGFHHDLDVDETGRIYALSEQVRILPRIHEHRSVVEDFITILDADGTIVRNVSLLEAFENSSYASMLDRMPGSGDLFHTNTLQVFDGSLSDRSPLFRKGNVLTSSREMSVIAIVDPDAGQVVWALAGQWKYQHHPTLLPDGRILLLDNCGHHGMSKVIEIDPFTQQIAWAYEGTPENGFFSRLIGANQRLPNGNTLITESTRGRAFEVTPDGRVVWEFYNPARAGDDGGLIATLFEMMRVPRDAVSPWLAGAYPVGPGDAGPAGP